MGSELNDDIFPLHIPELVQALPKCVNAIGRKGTASQVSYTRDFCRLLRMRGQADRKEQNA
jgi:hypothetical protein